MKQVGYNVDIHNYGRFLLNEVTEYQPTTLPLNTKQESALQELDQWDEPGFRQVKAILKNRYPDQLEYIFKKLKAKQGIEAAWAIEQFLQRIDALENGTDQAREDFAKADQEAVALLERREALTKAKRKHLQELINIVDTPQDTPQDQIDAIEQGRVKHEQDLKRLAIWMDRVDRVGKNSRHPTLLAHPHGTGEAQRKR